MNAGEAKRVAESFAVLCNTTIPRYEVVNKAGLDYLAIQVGSINDVYAAGIERIKAESESANPFGERIFLRATPPTIWLNSHETQILQRLISESLTVGRSTLQSDFYDKFIPFLGGEEGRIYSRANHVVFGRRGAGKSSLVLYTCTKRKRLAFPSAGSHFSSIVGVTTCLSFRRSSRKLSSLSGASLVQIRPTLTA